MSDRPPATFEGVCKRYGQIEALTDLTFEVSVGELFCLVGPDGAGKTTALELLGGLRSPDGGVVRTFGLDPGVHEGRVQARLGFVSQDFSLYGDLTVEENLDFFADIHDVPASTRVHSKTRLLDFARLGPFVGRRAGHLSGGMKKKLALCCALIHEPRLLILDEPTTGVDPVSRRELWEIVFSFLETGITVVVSTPYMDEAERCHRVGMLSAGRLIALDTPEQLKGLMEGDVLRVRGSPLEALERAARETSGAMDVTSYGDRIHVRTGAATAFTPRFQERVGALGARIEELLPITPTLEDVFLAREGGPTRGSGSDEQRHDVDRFGAAFGAVASRPEDEGAVRVRGLVRKFGSFTAVDHVDLDVRRGQIFGFLGPNGAGKTTTIRMLCGLLPPVDGEITVAGIDVVRHPRALRARVGYMSQHFSLHSDLTVVENLRLFGGLYGVSRRSLDERIQWVLRMAGLDGREGWLTRNLSGGWRQRLALGSALLHDPEVLFLDEPTSGVDPASRRRFWDLIYAVAQRGTTVFVTTHYMDEAEHCHRLALVYRGRIIAEDSPQGLRQNMRAGQLIELECDRVLQAAVDARQLPFVLEASPFGRTLHVIVKDADRDGPRLRDALDRRGSTVHEIRTAALSLEDIFVLFISMQDEATKEADRAQSS